MAQIKKEDIKQLSTEELKARIIEEKENMTKLRFNHTISPVDNPLTLRTARKTIARLMTEDRKRDMAAGSGEQAEKETTTPKASAAPKKTAEKKEAKESKAKAAPSAVETEKETKTEKK